MRLGCGQSCAAQQLEEWVYCTPAELCSGSRWCPSSIYAFGLDLRSNQICTGNPVREGAADLPELIGANLGACAVGPTRIAASRAFRRRSSSGNSSTRNSGPHRASVARARSSSEPTSASRRRFSFRIHPELSA